MIDLSKCKEIADGIFQKTEKTFYIKDIISRKYVQCTKRKIDKLVEKYGSLENISKQFTVAKKEKSLIKSSVQTIQAILINDIGKEVNTFVSEKVSQVDNKIVYSFKNANFDKNFVFVIKLNEELYHPSTKSFKEVIVRLFNGHSEEKYAAVYDQDSGYYCVLDCDSAHQLISIEVEH